MAKCSINTIPMTLQFNCVNQEPLGGCLSLAPRGECLHFYLRVGVRDTSYCTKVTLSDRNGHHFLSSVTRTWKMSICRKVIKLYKQNCFAFLIAAALILAHLGLWGALQIHFELNKRCLIALCLGNQGSDVIYLEQIRMHKEYFYLGISL